MITLRVVEALAKDLGRGIVRVDPQDIAHLDAAIGDIVRLKGKRATAARLMPTYPRDRGRGIIQMDELARENGGLEAGDAVEVEKILARRAHSVTLACRESSDLLLHNCDHWSPLLDWLTVTTGDRVQLKPLSTPPVQFRVLRTWPKGTALIEPATEIKIRAQFDQSRCL